MSRKLTLETKSQVKTLLCIPEWKHLYSTSSQQVCLRFLKNVTLCLAVLPRTESELTSASLESQCHSPKEKETTKNGKREGGTILSFEGNVFYIRTFYFMTTYPHCPMYELKMQLEDKYVWRCELNLKECCNLRLPWHSPIESSNGLLWIVTPAWWHFQKHSMLWSKPFLPGTKPSGYTVDYFPHTLLWPYLLKGHLSDHCNQNQPTY